ncbi:MAG TPA: transglutaminase-like domain-containing protein [Kofleriaceae bacterium]|nr:transglutaminase-like domain-containing protein [Kofleriaceae bacterium]
MRAALLALFAVQAGGCTKPPGMPADMPTEQHRDQVRFYEIWLGGARVGTARESEVWSATGVHLRREEKMLFLREDTPITMTTTIEIDADTALVANHVRWSERYGEGAKATERAAEANLDENDAKTNNASGARGGWSVSTGERIDRRAVPAELVPLIVRRDGTFDGAVFLPARGFVSGAGHIEAIAPGRLVAHLDLQPGAVVEATIDLADDGMPARVVDGEGVIARRVNESQAAEWFPAVDLVAATSIPIDGTPNRGVHRISLVGDLALPAVPGQQARVSPTGVEVSLDASLAGDLPAGPDQPRDRAAEIKTLVTAVRARITPDLGAGHTSSRDAAAATAGDCTTFALAYAALATQRQIPTRVVTGLRVDDRTASRLVRHRWAVSWTGTKWIAIDAAFGAVPAGGNLIGLAIHDADDAGLVAGEAALTQVRGATWQ